MLAESGLEFIDLNHDDVVSVANTLGYTRLRELMLPVTLLRADLIVSMPKMKTHHWAGVTLATEKSFRRDARHLLWLAQERAPPCGNSRVDTRYRGRRAPHLAIVDGIIGMEGDGPIMGTPKASGVLVMGTNLPAVDATSARLMGVDPWRVAYLVGASGQFGPIAEAHITQRGEPIAPLMQPYEIPIFSSLAGTRG